MFAIRSLMSSFTSKIEDFTSGLFGCVMQNAYLIDSRKSRHDIQSAYFLLQLYTYISRAITTVNVQTDSDSLNKITQAQAQIVLTWNRFQCFTNIYLFKPETVNELRNKPKFIRIRRLWSKLGIASRKKSVLSGLYLFLILCVHAYLFI